MAAKSGVKSNVNVNVPTAAEDIIVFTLLLAVFGLMIIWIINTLSNALGSATDDADSAATTVLNAPGTIIGGVFGKGAVLGWVNPGNWF